VFGMPPIAPPPNISRGLKPSLGHDMRARKSLSQSRETGRNRAAENRAGIGENRQRNSTAEKCANVFPQAGEFVAKF